MKTRPPPSPTLPTLPHDILRIIASHLPTASCLASLSTTSKLLHSFIALEGWRVFVQTRFPSFHADVIRESQSQQHHRTIQSTDWRTWAQEQTLVNRNWQRRGFIARVLEPEIFISVPTGPRAGPRGRDAPARTTKWAWSPGSSRGRQTMKYLPVVDVYESVWSGGEEVLGIGAGPDLVLRKRNGGDVVGKNDRWWGFENRDERAGRDDLTAIQLLQYGERGSYAAKGEVAVVGRANGKLEMVGLRTDSEAWSIGSSEVLKRYETGGLTVKSASLMHRGGSLEIMMSAILGNCNIALYPIDTPDSSAPSIPQTEAVEPVSEISLTDGEIPWKTTFLSSSLLALGTTSSTPLSIYAISPDDGFRKKPLRTFSALECTETKITSVYAIAALPSSTGSTDTTGEVFLGGWYDGTSRLHDLRSPSQSVATYADPIDAQTPIYSLAPLGRHRFIVGGGRHCILKIFDLRMSDRVYAYPPTSSPGWATYLSPPARHRPNSASVDWESPIYALAVGAGGKTVYGGVQGRVWEMDFVGPQGQMREMGPVGLHGSNAGKDVGSRLTMYEFGWTGTMYRQGPESQMGKGRGRIDARWRATLANAEL